MLIELPRLRQCWSYKTIHLPALKISDVNRVGLSPEKTQEILLHDFQGALKQSETEDDLTALCCSNGCLQPSHQETDLRCNLQKLMR